MINRCFLLVALVFVSLPVLAQSSASDAPLKIRPAATFSAQGDGILPGPDANDALTDEQLARRISRLYDRQATLLQSFADGNIASYTGQLDALVVDLQLLAQRPGVLYDSRFREVYSSVLTEQERFYGEAALDRGDVFLVRAAGITAVEDGFDLGAPLLEHVTIPNLGTYTSAFPMELNPKVENYIQFLVNRPNHTGRLRSRAETYFPMVERILEEEGVPDELKYLAMIESALNPVAQSHAGAAGMWQFIRATGRAYGLESGSEVDLRLDPEIATRAAARHLRDLHDRFGDWQLALAGYNCNPAVIARAVRRFEERTGRRATFWDIDGAIPRETRAYVPMFIATSLVMSNPDAYGVPSVEPGPQFSFDRIPVRGGTRLSTIARVLDVDESVLRALNPSLKQGRMPSGNATETLRIPVGFHSQFAEQLEPLAPENVSSQYAAETVSFGARRNRPLAPQDRMDALVAVATRQQARREADSPIRRRDAVPAYASATPPEVAQFQARQAREQRAQEVAAPPTPEVILVAQAAPAPRVVERAPEPAPARMAPVVEAPAPPPARPSAAAIEAAGGLIAPALVAYARKVPVEPEVQTPSPAPAPVTIVQPQVPIRTASTSSERRVATTHRVQSGEGLMAIGRQYGVTAAQIREWNNLRGDGISVGQTLRISADGATRSATSTRSAAPSNRTHRVSSGEHLTSIARRYGVTVRQIMEWNSLSGETIRVGQSLVVGRATATARG